MRHQLKCFHCHVESEKRTDWTSLQNRRWLTDIEKLMVSRGDSLGGGGMCLGCGVEILWDWMVMIIIQLQMWSIHLSNLKKKKKRLNPMNIYLWHPGRRYLQTHFHWGLWNVLHIQGASVSSWLYHSRAAFLGNYNSKWNVLLKQE